MTAPAATTPPAIEPTTQWRSRITGSGTEDARALVANPRNWRTHPKHQAAALTGMLDQVGWVQQVIVNQRTGLLVDGHLRVELAVKHGETAVPVVYVDLDPSEEALVLASLDPLAGLAGQNDDALRALLDSVTIDSADLAAMLRDLSPAPKAGLTDPDDVPPPPTEVYVQPGDLWIMGDHRLLCGDSTDPDGVARLLDGAKPALMVTDPPYGVGYDPAWRNVLDYRKGRRLGEVTNDDRADWSPVWDLSPSTVAYVWHGGLHAGVVAASLASAGFEVRSQIIWAKPHIVFGRGAYHWRHEPCYYAVRKGSDAAWIGDRKQETIWEVGAVNLYRDATPEDPWTEHSTQKPVECMERPMRNHAGDVYEPFSGSGTTLIAAERQGRRCYALELEPRYAQMAIERWQAYTGREASRG